MNVFITGTDTGAGKTYVATRWVRALRARGIDAVGMKPICCGGREDAEALLAASEGALTLNEVNPVWLRAPVAPYLAAMIEERMCDVDLIRDTFSRLRLAHAAIVVEGVGGWRVPIRRDFFLSDLAVEIGFPVVVVAANRLGAINHTLLTVDAVRASGLECAGIVLTQVSADESVATLTNRNTLEELAGVPVLSELAFRAEDLALDLSRLTLSAGTLR